MPRYWEPKFINGGWAAGCTETNSSGKKKVFCETGERGRILIWNRQTAEAVCREKNRLEEIFSGRAG